MERGKVNKPKSGKSKKRVLGDQYPNTLPENDYDPNMNTLPDGKIIINSIEWTIPDFGPVPESDQEFYNRSQLPEKKERCKKVCFINEDFAIQYINKLRATSVRTKVPSRAYLCEHCLNWHLSSKGEYTDPTNKKDSKIESRLTPKTEAKKNDAIEQRDNRIKNLEKKLNASYDKITDLTRTIVELRQKNQELLKK